MKICGVQVKVGDHVAISTTTASYDRAAIIRLDEDRMEFILPYSGRQEEFDIKVEPGSVTTVRLIQSGEDAVREQSNDKFKLGQVILTRKCWYWHGGPFVGSIVAAIDGMLFVENSDSFQTCDTIDHWYSIDDLPWLKKQIRAFKAERERS